MNYSKLNWKKLLKRNIIRVWRHKLEMDAIEKSTLCYLKPNYQPNTLHPAIVGLTNEREIRRANTKLRILTGTYTVQTIRHKYKQSTSSVCIICGRQDENIKHFLLECEELSIVRKSSLSDIVNIIPSVFLHKPQLFTNPDLILQLLIDCSHDNITDKFPIQQSLKDNIERQSQKLLYKLHLARINLLQK